MLVDFAYGSSTKSVDLPNGRTTVVSGHYPAPCGDEVASVRAAIRQPVAGPPLHQRVRPGQTVAIAVCDGTRPQPRRLVLPALLEELSSVVRLEDVFVIVATGTHRGNTQAELEEMLGPEVMGSVRVVNHDARDEGSLTWAGLLGAGVPVWLNSLWLSADFRVTTGFVEPHFFAGFSGGPKLVAPGLAGLETTLVLHDAAHIGHPQARWGVTEGNPVHDDVRAIARATGVDFSLDVVIDRQRRLVGAFGGDLFAVHSEACKMSRAAAMCSVPGLFDVVVTSNAGFPLDQNLYQSVKGMSAAAQVVKPGGLVVCVAECRDGFPAHGSYHAELSSAPSVTEFLERVHRREKTVPDQWQVQVQASIMSHSRVVVSTGFLSDRQLADVHLEQTHDIEATVAEAGPNATVCALPEGPMTVPYVA